MESDPTDSKENGAATFGRRGYLQTIGALATGAAFGTATTGAVGASSHDVEVSSVVIDEEWTTIDTSADHSDPIVVAGPISHNGGQPATTRFRNVSGSSFDTRVEEWEYLDGHHINEPIGYLVTDTGAGLADGSTNMVAGTVETDENWKTASFPSSFDSGPVVFSQIQTHNGADSVVTRNSSIRQSNFSVKLQEEESRGAHTTEKIGYLAAERGTGTVNGRPTEAGLVMADDYWVDIEFDRSYEDPIFLADFQSYNGGNTCNIRYQNLSGTGVEVLIDEEQSNDDETAHVKEQVGYLVVEGGDSGSSGGGSGNGDSGYGAGGYGAGGYGQ